MAKPTRQGSGKDSTTSGNNDFNSKAAAPKIGVSASGSNDNKVGMPSIFDRMRQRSEERKLVSFEFLDWLEAAKTNKSLYALPAENIISAIGDPEIVNTANADEKTKTYYESKSISRYAPFKEFFDAEEEVSQLVGILKNTPETIIVANGPVGSGKTEMAVTIEKQTELKPISVLRCKVTGQVSPFQDSPLCLLTEEGVKQDAIKEYGIHRKYLHNLIRSPWVMKRLEAHDWNVSEAFDVVSVYPSREKEFGVSKCDPGSADTPNLSLLIGSVDMSKVGAKDELFDGLYKRYREQARTKLEEANQLEDDVAKGEMLEEVEMLERKAVRFRGKLLSEGDPDAYITGYLSRANGGMLHLAEFFRNHPDMFKPFLEAVTEGSFKGAGSLGKCPFRALVMITSNGPVADEFYSLKSSDAARDRIKEIKVGYTLRLDAELKIYKKFLEMDGFDDKPVAPKTLDLLAEFSIAARLKDGVNNALKPYDIFTRVKVHNGEKPDGTKVPSIKELRKSASPEERMQGFGVRNARMTLKMAYQLREAQGFEEADTITMLESIRKNINGIKKQDMSDDEKKTILRLVDTLEERNRKDLEKIVNDAIMGADESTCQGVFDDYIRYARAWKNGDVTHTSIGEPMDTTRIVRELEAFEKRANITNGPDFRKTTVNYIDSKKAELLDRIMTDPTLASEVAGKPIVRWTDYEPVAKVIRAQFDLEKASKARIFRAKVKTSLQSEDEQRQHTMFHENMKAQGYTDSMVQRMMDYLDFK